MNSLFRPLRSRDFEPLSAQQRAIVHLIRTTTIMAATSNLADIWTSSAQNRRLFCCRAAKRMRDVVQGALDTRRDDANLLVALDDWRWELCQLSAHSPATIIKLLTQAFRTCVAPDFHPRRHVRDDMALSGMPLSDAPRFHIGHEVTDRWRRPHSVRRELSQAQRSFEKTLNRALSV